MKMIKLISAFSLLIALSACATHVHFPVSNVVPGANISATKKTDKQKNITLEVTTRNLASSDRLDPPGNNYSIWIVTKKYGVKNVGQLNVDNGGKNSFKTVTPFDFDEVFITVEQQGNLEYPRGVEIARTRI